MANDEQRNQEDFLNDCDTDDAAGYRLVFESIKPLIADFHDRGYDLWFEFKGKGWSLLLADPKKVVLKNNASLLWGFPSKGVDENFRNRVKTRRSDLEKAGLPRKLIDSYFEDLLKTSFTRDGKVECVSRLGGEDRAIWKNFQYPLVRAHMVEAIKSLVDGLDELAKKRSDSMG